MQITRMILVVCVMAIGGCTSYPSVPVHLDVFSADGQFSRTVYYETISQRKVWNLQYGSFLGRAEEEVVVMLDLRADILDAKSGRLLKSIPFQGIDEFKGIHSSLIRENDQLYLTRSGSGFSDAGLIDQFGNDIWRRHWKKSGDMFFADLDRDGELEFYTHLIWGIKRFDFDGTLIWENMNIHSYAASFVDDRDGKRGLLMLNGFAWDKETEEYKEKYEIFLDADGNVVEKQPSQRPEYSRLPLNWPDNGNYLGEYHTDTEAVFLVSNIEGEKLFEYRMPNGGFKYRFYALGATPVRFESDKAPYLAILLYAREKGFPGYVLIFSPEGKLVLNDKLKSNHGLVAIPDSDGTESLLVGDGGTTVWRYDFTPEADQIH